MEVDLGVTVKYMIHVHWSEIKHTKITNMCSWWTTMIKNKIKSCLRLRYKIQSWEKQNKTMISNFLVINLLPWSTCMNVRSNYLSELKRVWCPKRQQPHNNFTLTSHLLSIYWLPNITNKLKPFLNSLSRYMYLPGTNSVHKYRLIHVPLCTCIGIFTCSWLN